MYEKKPLIHNWLRKHVSLELGSAEPATQEAVLPMPPLWLKWLGIGFTAVVVLVLGWLVAGYSLQKLSIGQASLHASSSDKTLAGFLNEQASGYRLKIAYPDKSVKTYTTSQLGLKLDTAASIKSIRSEQHKLPHRLLWWQPVPVQLSWKSNNVQLNEFISKSINQTVQPSQDAQLSIVNGQISVADAKTGKDYGLIRPRTTLKTAAAILQSQPVKLQTLTTLPAISAKALQPYKPLLEKTLNQPVSLNIGTQVVKPGPNDIANWLEITPDDKTRKVDIEVNSGKVQEYINRIASSMIHPPKAEIDVRNPDGSSRVLVPGINGVDVTDKSTVATQIANNLLDGKGLSASLSVNNAPFQTITTNNYDKWIEVDLTNKRLYAYEKDNLVKTVLVSAGAPATPTVTGQFAIYAKYDSQDMRGQNVDGSNYFQPNVQWINYFYKDYAIHGNYWRPTSYFGNINSSHGCVGAVNSEAAWIYNWAPIGTPVITHT